MKNDTNWALWQEYQSAWKRAELLQYLWEGGTVLFGVIYDRYQRR